MTILETLSRGFATRSISEGYMDDPEVRRAYGEYFGEVGYEKGWALSREIINRSNGFLRQKKRLSIVDLGTGTGEFVSGICSGLRINWSGPINLLCVDRSQKALKDFSEAHKPSEGISRLIETAVLPDDMSWVDRLGEIDLLTMANLLAENEDRSQGFFLLLTRLLGALAENGLMVLVEPADRRSSRALLRLGDQLLNHDQDLRILAPCPNDRRGSCPALDSPDDWCHEDRPINFSSGMKRTAGALGHIKDSLKMTYLIFARRKNFSFSSENPLLRLVSPLHGEKGMSWGIFCDGSSLRRLRLLNRNRNDNNREFGHLRRGESIRLPEFLENGPSRMASSSFLDWPKDSPVLGVERPDGTPWNHSPLED